jgi:hypothetical protein
LSERRPVQEGDGERRTSQFAWVVGGICLALYAFTGSISAVAIIGVLIVILAYTTTPEP